MARSADHNGGGAKRRTPSPGLAGLMWVSSVTGWQSDPEGEALGSGMGTRSRAAGLAFSGSIAGTRGLNYRIEILRQVVIIRRGIGFSACFFYLFFLFSCFFFFFFPPLFPLRVALMDDLLLISCCISDGVKARKAASPGRSVYLGQEKQRITGRLGGLGKAGGMEERGPWPLWVGWLGRQRQDRAVWGSVQPAGILIPSKTQKAPTPHPIPIYYCASDFFKNFFFVASSVTHLFLYLSVGSIGGRKYNSNLY